MPRQTKGEHEAALAEARAEGANKAANLVTTLDQQGIDLAVIVGALSGLVMQLADEAERLADEAKRPAGQSA